MSTKYKFIFTFLVLTLFALSSVWAQESNQNTLRDDANETAGEVYFILSPNYLPLESTESTLLYDNGTLVNNPGGGAGGADESMLQSVSLGMNTLGFGHQIPSNNRMADDFTVSDPAGWNVDSLVFYAYQTNSPITSTITEVRYQIWDGPPNDSLSNVLFGDLVTNQMIHTAWSNIYRVSETTSGSTSRPIMKSTVSAGFFLPAGTYWVEWFAAGSLASGPWAPPITINGTDSTGNAWQFSSGNWHEARDSGTNGWQGLPFLIYGDVAGGPSWSYGMMEVIDGGNPGGVNGESDAPGLLDWTVVVPGPQSANIWSPVQPIPFYFEFFGVPVTHFMASQNCVVTFDTTATALPGNNSNLPSVDLPSMTVAGYWDDFTDSPPTGSGDDIRVKVFGTPPHQQLWIKWYSFEYGNPFTSFQYSAVVLEESSNKIYLVDLYGSSTGSPALTTTAGLQFDTVYSVQWDADTLHLAGNGSSNTDNDFIEFYPLLDHDYAVNWVSPETNLMVADTTYAVEAEVENLGTNAETDVPVSLFEDGSQVGGDLLVSLNPGEKDTVQFSYTPTTPGDFALSVQSFLAGDQNPNNDAASADVSVYPAGTTFQQVLLTSGLIDKPIIDQTTTLDTLTFALDQGAEITDVELIIDSLTHTWDSDLDMYLISPYGDSLELSTDNGSSGDNYIGTVFDDQATISITAGSAPFTGFFQPEGFPPGFGQWNGMDPTGGWSLSIFDDANGDVGTLHQWSMLFTIGTIPPTATLPFSEGFNDTSLIIPTGWTQFELDAGDEVPGADWRTTDATVSNVAPLEGIGYIFNNFVAADPTGYIDEWLVTPQLLNYQAGMELSFWLNHVSGPWDDSVMVMVSTTGMDPGDFTQIDYINCEITWTQYSYDLGNYGVSPGDHLYIAFRYLHFEGGSTGNHSNYFGLEDMYVGFPPVLNPPRDLQAAGGDAVVDLSWLPPLPFGELGYDDGTSETGFGFGNAGEFAVRFTPNVYPSTLLGIKTYWANIATPNDSVQYSVWVNPAGGDNAPTTQVVANTDYIVPVRGQFSEVDISGQGIQISQGDFFYSWVQPAPPNFGIGLDQSSPDAGRSWASLDGGASWAKISAFGFPDNLMIRALVQEGTGPNARIVELAPDEVKPMDLAQIKLLRAEYGHLFEYALQEKGIVGDVSANTLKYFGIEALQGYDIYRSEDNVTFNMIASVDTSTLVYSDNTVTNDLPYWYYVQAVYDEGVSGPSNVAMATPTAGAVEAVADHVTSVFRGTITNEGNIGFLNGFPPNPGSGFQFNPPTSAGQRLFEGAIMIGTDSAHVSDAARDETQVFDADFQFLSSIDSSLSSGLSTVYQTSYNDALAENPIGIEVLQTTFSYDSTGANSGIIFQFDLTNTSGTALTDVHLGGFFDWDVNPATAADRGQVVVDSQNVIPGINNGNPFFIEVLELHQGVSPNSWMGIVPLSANIFAGRRIGISSLEVYPPHMTDEDKWTYMTQDRATNPNGDGGSAQDHAPIFGLPPVSIGAGATVRVGFAIGGGTSLSEIVDAARAAQRTWVEDLGNDLTVIPVTGIDDPLATIPKQFAIQQNYPNPFNPSTSIKYQLPKATDVNIAIYNLLGQKVRTLVNDRKDPGYYEVEWNGLNDNGVQVATGLYIYRIQAADFVRSKKMLLLK